MKTRHTLWLLTFCGFGVNYMLRINLNIAIVEMVRPSMFKNEAKPAECIRNQNKLTLSNGNDTKSDIRNISNIFDRALYDWNEYEQNLILSSYYWMHWATELPGGLLAHYYGTKHTFGLGNFLVALLTFFVPLSTYFGFNVLVGVRFLQGLIAGCVWPSMHSMVAKWIPPNERGRFVSSYLGSSVGTAFTYFICGYIIDWYGWEYVFYVTGGLAALWYIAWMMLVYETPQEHPWISNEEREYIENSIGDTINKNKLPVPWKEILCCKNVWINMIAQWGATGGIFAMVTHTPTYLKFVHGLHIKSNGIWSGFPHLTRWICSFIFGIFSQYQTCMSKRNVRKLATATCTIGFGILTLGLAFSGCNSTMTVIFLILAITLQGAISTGPLASVIDMSPNFSSIIQGMIGSASVTSGFVYPLIAGYLTQNNQSSSQWQKYFFVVAALAIFFGMLECLFGSSELQPWNSGKQKIKEMKPLQKRKLLRSDVRAPI